MVEVLAQVLVEVLAVQGLDEYRGRRCFSRRHLAAYSGSHVIFECRFDVPEESAGGMGAVGPFDRGL